MVQTVLESVLIVFWSPGLQYNSFHWASIDRRSIITTEATAEPQLPCSRFKSCYFHSEQGYSNKPDARYVGSTLRNRKIRWVYSISNLCHSDTASIRRIRPHSASNPRIQAMRSEDILCNPVEHAMPPSQNSLPKPVPVVSCYYAYRRGEQTSPHG